MHGGPVLPPGGVQRRARARHGLHLRVRRGVRWLRGGPHRVRGRQRVRRGAVRRRRILYQLCRVLHLRLRLWVPGRRLLVRAGVELLRQPRRVRLPGRVLPGRFRRRGRLPGRPAAGLRVRPLPRLRPRRGLHGRVRGQRGFFVCGRGRVRGRALLQGQLCGGRLRGRPRPRHWARVRRMPRRVQGNGRDVRALPGRAARNHRLDRGRRRHHALEGHPALLPSHKLRGRLRELRLGLQMVYGHFHRPGLHPETHQRQPLLHPQRLRPQGHAPRGRDVHLHAHRAPARVGPH
mmetsp:Transcript_55092/g.175255  ORF Transcript_55092/g.175255 Transcript_55092/m.175255 type:complete len:291 (+) Transcript_55092:682-1554(+)